MQRRVFIIEAGKAFPVVAGPASDQLKAAGTVSVTSSTSATTGVHSHDFVFVGKKA